MRLLLASSLMLSSLILGGCMAVPMFDSYDANKVDQNMKKLEDERMERMRKNSGVNAAEYDAFNSRRAGGSGAQPLPPPPTLEELRRQVEAEKASK